MPVTISGTTGVQGNLTGDSVTATTVNSNLVTGTGTVPTGAVFYFAASTPPPGFLVCDGSIVPNGTGTIQGISANFLPLYNVVQTTYGFAGQLPDLRGEFIRGVDGGRGVDSGRVLGSFQQDLIRAHNHIGGVAGSALAAAGGGQTVVPGQAITGGVVNANSGIETRPRNVALLPCIKY